MESLSNGKSQNKQIPSDERKTLEVEYQVAMQIFLASFTQSWQTFAAVSTLALAGLAFIGQMKASAGGKVTWPATVAVGLAMITVLIVWTALARRWWAYMGIYVHRMKEIEARLGEMYLVREMQWLRRPLSDSDLSKLSDDEQHQYRLLVNAVPKFPQYQWRQEVLTSIMITALILIWILFMVADVFALI